MHCKGRLVQNTTANTSTIDLVVCRGFRAARGAKRELCTAAARLIWDGPDGSVWIWWLPRVGTCPLRDVEDITCAVFWGSLVRDSFVKPLGHLLNDVAMVYKGGRGRTVAFARN